MFFHFFFLLVPSLTSRILGGVIDLLKPKQPHTDSKSEFSYNSFWTNVMSAAYSAAAIAVSQSLATNDSGGSHFYNCVCIKITACVPLQHWIIGCYLLQGAAGSHKFWGNVICKHINLGLNINIWICVFLLFSLNFFVWDLSFSI